MLNTIYGVELYNESFADIWDTATKFLTDYKASGLYLANNKISDDSARALYYLLYASYGNNTIASNDPNRFKYKVFQLIFSYGPTWEKQLKIQDDLRKLDIEDLQVGNKIILNHAYNPGTSPSTVDTEELNYVNDQNVNKSTKSLGEAYAILLGLLQADVTQEFIGKFKPLFKMVIQPDAPIVFRNPEIDIHYDFDYGWQGQPEREE